MKKIVAAAAAVVALLALGACGTVKVKEGNKECTTVTIGIFGASIGAPLNNGCKG